MRNVAATISVVLGFLSAAAHASTLARIEEGFVPTEDGTRLYYEKVGSGKQTVIIPLRLFAFEAFKQIGDQFTVIAYDTRGRGRSDAIPDDEKAGKLGLQNDVADVERVRRHFQVGKTSLIGYSYAGLVIILYTMEHPDRVERLVQLGPVPMKFGTVCGRSHGQR